MSTTTTTTNTFDRNLWLADKNPPVCSLEIKDAFKELTHKEKLYSHHLSQACWSGARIIMGQTTPHSESIFNLIIAIFSSSEKGKMTNLDLLKQNSGLKEEDWEDVLSYSAQVLSNLSNFKSFGSSKFIPRVDASAFTSLIKVCENSTLAIEYWNLTKEEIYSLSPEAKLTIGKPNDGHVSAYYPSNPAPSDKEVDEVQSLCDAKGISTLNTRLSKKSDKELLLLIASSDESNLPSHWPKSLKSEKMGFEVKLIPGDFNTSLKKVNLALEKAIKSAANENQVNMMLNYQKSFEKGDIEDHKNASRYWVKDVGPVVESYIGFIESYVDPFGGRAEWEGFVAIVNKEQSKKYNKLVDMAPTLVKTLPWPSEFEITTFKRPDFTALEILSFATGGIPAGINIPNYHDVREEDGFKNVSLSNILSAKAAGEVVTFIPPEQIASYEFWESKAFAVQVSTHELIGHGTGKILSVSSEGVFNFDRNLINPLTGKKVESWYKPGETYGSKMGSISSSMEECRAESVALYLASNSEVLKLFGYETQEEQDDLTYFTFVGMARAGVRALEFYDPKFEKHAQAHMEARLGIFNRMISENLATVEYIYSTENPTILIDAYVRVNKEEVLKRGKQVMGQLLIEIQIRKSTGDGIGAEKFYKQLTTPSPQFISLLRPLVLSKKLPRKIFVQPNTFLTHEGDEVELREYEVSTKGVIRSFIEREI